MRRRAPIVAILVPLACLAAAADAADLVLVERGVIARKAGKVAVRFRIMLAMIRGGYMGGVEDYFGPPSETFKKAAAQAAP